MTQAVTPLIATIFLASLVGSLHCAGMCGAFLALAIEGVDAEPRPGQRAACQAMYHVGRLTTYATFGAIAGTIGSVVDHAGTFAGIQRAANALGAATITLMGAFAIVRLLSHAPLRMPMPRTLHELSARLHRRAFDLPPLSRAFAVGLLTTLLPCGWLYVFVAAAAGTGSPAKGVLSMSVFWLGTLPVLVALGTGLQAFAGPLRRRLPIVTAVLVTLLGLYTMSQRFWSPLHVPSLAASIMPGPTISGSARCNP